MCGRAVPRVVRDLEGRGAHALSVAPRRTRCTRCARRPEKDAARAARGALRRLCPQISCACEALNGSWLRNAGFQVPLLRDARSPSLFQLCSGECRARGHTALGRPPLSPAGRGPPPSAVRGRHTRQCFLQIRERLGAASRAPLRAGPPGGAPRGHAPLAIFSAGWSGAVALRRVVRRTRQERSR